MKTASTAAFVAVSAATISAVAGGNTVGPDITVGGLTGATTFGAVDDTHSYALAFTACNMGDTPLDWFDNSPRHPVFATQLYRLADGRF